MFYKSKNNRKIKTKQKFVYNSNKKCLNIINLVVFKFIVNVVTLFVYLLYKKIDIKFYGFFKWEILTKSKIKNHMRSGKTVLGHQAHFLIQFVIFKSKFLCTHCLYYVPWLVYVRWENWNAEYTLISIFRRAHRIDFSVCRWNYTMSIVVASIKQALLASGTYRTSERSIGSRAESETDRDERWTGQWPADANVPRSLGAEQ